MPQCTGLVKVGTPNERPCGCRTSYRMVYIDRVYLLPTENEEHRCGKHRALPQPQNHFLFVTKYPINRPDRGEVLYHLPRGTLPRFPELREFIEINAQYGTADWDRMILAARQTVINRALMGNAGVEPRRRPAPAAVPPAPAAVPPARPAPGIPFVPQGHPVPVQAGPAMPYPAHLMNLSNIKRMVDLSKKEKVVVEYTPPPPPPPSTEPTYIPDPHAPMKEGESRLCAVCMTDAGTVVCSEQRHTMCEECFADYAVIESEEASFDGELRCCGFKPYGCKANAFSQLFVVRKLSDIKASAFLKGCELSKERRTIEEFKRVETERVQRESALSEVEKARNHIVDNILTIRCPNDRCGAAILDFTGCLALKCARCKIGICAKCFEHCGTDAHVHIKNGACKIDSNKQLFANDEYIKNVQMLYKTRKLNEYMKTLAPSVATKVIEKYQGELREGGVNV